MKTKKTLSILLRKPTTIAEKFHQYTKIGSKKTQIRVPSPINPWSRTQYKEYLRMEKILLAKPRFDNKSLQTVLFQRTSHREFSNKPLTLEQISTLLYYSSGIHNAAGVFKRFYPSAGGRYPLEVYVLSLNTELPIGLYHYNPRINCLEVLEQYSKPPSHKKFFAQDLTTNTSGVLLITARFPRTTTRYGERGYRHILIEAGHLGQNVYLLSSALDIGCVGLGGYKDDAINPLLSVDGFEEAVVYTLALGTKKKKR